MSLRLVPMPDDPQRAAICYGPCVLAAALGTEGIVAPAPYAKGQSDFFNKQTAPPAPVLLGTPGRAVSDWVEPVAGQPLTFRTKGVGKPAEVTLVAFHALPPQRYTIYFDLITAAQWQQREAAAEAAAQLESELAARTVDGVRIGEFEPERAHNFNGERSESGTFGGRLWRHATAGGSFSYELRSAPGPLELVCTYWGGETGAREFDVVVEGSTIATQKLNLNQPGEFFDVVHSLPATLTAGKPTITVKFQAHPNQTAGGIFGLRLLKPAK